MKFNFPCLVLFTWLQFPFVISAQTSPGLKTFIPPSPNATALAKYGDIPVSLYTGIPSINIPLYTVKGRDLELPINLSYHASGIKVEEIASWVGIGWSLNAGGVITRSVRGYPDDVPTGYFGERTSVVPLAKKYITNLNPTTSSAINQGNADIDDQMVLDAIKDGVMDAEPDIFYFNFGKYSGKFFLNENGQFTVSPIQPLKIQYQYISAVNSNQIARWTITTPDGIIYTFGNSTDGQRTAIEKNDNAAQNVATTTGWYLLDIRSPNNDAVSLDYNTISYNYKNKSAETLNLLLGQVGDPYSSIPYLNKNIVTNYMSVPIIKSITSANEKIIFESLISRTDLPGDKSLGTIKIFNSSDLVNPQTKFNFSYDYSNGGRLTLISIEEFSGANITSGNKHRFEYSPTQLPDPNPDGVAINSQDLWGFYNGAANDVLPQTFYVTTQAYGTLTINGADRHSDESYMAAGTLKKIIYPTGGYALFDYEANKVYTTAVNSIPSTPVGKASSLQYFTGQTLSNTFTISNATIGGEPGTTHVTVNAHAMTSTPGCQVSPTSGYSTCFTAYIEGFNGTSFPRQYFPDGTSTIELANGNYKIVGTGEAVQGYPNASYHFYLNLNWNEYPPAGGGSPNAMVNKIIGGLRIKRITVNDNIGTSVKKYLYTKFDDAGQSSAVLVNNPYHYANIFQIISACGSSMYAQVRSYPLIPLLQSQGEAVGYQNVTEMEGENGENGKTEFLYTTASDYPDEIKDYRPYPGVCSYDWRRGQLLKSTIYKLEEGAFVPVKSISNKYSFNINPSTGYGLSVETSIELVQNCDGNLVALTAQNYYVSGYKTVGEFYYLQSDTTTIFDQNNSAKYIRKINDYTYDITKGHYQLIKTVTTGSNNEILQTENKYPQDITLTGTAETARQSLITNYRISTVLDQITSKNGTQINKTRNNYKVWPNGLTLPDNTEVQVAGYPSEKRVEFLKYDGFANILQQRKISDILHAYIWDYNNALPIAEVMNIGPADSIAYTSFEADGKGNWNFSGTPITEFNPPTGKKSYDLSYGNITKTSLNASKTYIITYWSRSGQQSVNGASPIVIGNNINNWVYYKYKITGATTITISGSGVIDELRLYPLGAQMETYTYDPLAGMTSKCSINNDISYFDYDAFGRLKVVSDQFRRVQKKYCYNYAGQTQSCSVTPAAVNLTSTNQLGVSGFTATYTNVNTGQSYVFNISSVQATVQNPSEPLGQVPSGNYNLTIQKTTTNTTLYTFGSGCASMTTDGTSATFYNITVSPALCNKITISILL